MKFKALSDDFFDDLHSGLKTPFVCNSCTQFLCSCSGGSKTRAVLLPGEEEWMLKKFKVKLPIVAPYLFEVCGDCTFLDEKKSCIGKFEKPFDCHSFPLCPIWDDATDQFIPRMSDNCSYPAPIPDSWYKEIWLAWQKIQSCVDRNWCRFYETIPNYDQRLLQIK